MTTHQEQAARQVELEAAIEVSMNRIRALVANLPGREPAPAPAPAADRPLWEVMQDAHLNEAGMVQYSNSSQPVLGEPDRFTRAAEIDAVAEWLDARAVGVDAVVVLHAEARRAREGA